MTRPTTLLAAALLTAFCRPVAGVAAPATPLVWATLGTAGGPVVNASRSQPANMLLVEGKPWLVDCGDGAAERVAAMGFQPARIDTIFISHLHMDHIGGLQGMIGLRWMQVAPGTLTIYGPPGIDQVVAGILQSLKPSETIGLGQARTPDPAKTVTVVVIEDGSEIEVGGVRVRVVRNSHFDDRPGHTPDNGTQSLSYRFDFKGYAVGFTGDTGPSDAVARLEKGVDLLVSEVIDLQGIEATLRSPGSPMPAAVVPALIEHLRTQHLTPQEAGKIATAADVHRLVFTHLGIDGPADQLAPKLIAGARETFMGDVQVAHDLDRF